MHSYFSGGISQKMRQGAMKKKKKEKADERCKHEICILGNEDILAENVDLLAVEDSDKGHWVKEEAAVDSGSFDSVINRKKVPHLRVYPTPESERGEHWFAAGGQEISKEGEVVVPWFTDQGHAKKSRLKVGNVGRTLISVSRLNERGYEAYLTQKSPCIANWKTGEKIFLRKERGMYILTMWLWVPAETGFQRPR